MAPRPIERQAIVELSDALAKDGAAGSPTAALAVEQLPSRRARSVRTANLIEVATKALGASLEGILVRPVAGDQPRPVLPTARPAGGAALGSDERVDSRRADEPLPPSRTRLLRERRETDALIGDVPLAQWVEGVGVGMGDPASFDLAPRLARRLGAAIGGTRTVCDLGWLPRQAQIGLTSQVIAPVVYSVLGVRGGTIRPLRWCWQATRWRSTAPRRRRPSSTSMMDWSATKPS